MRIGIAGARSTIGEEFWKCATQSTRNYPLSGIPRDLDAYLICTGYLAGRRIAELTEEQADLTWRRNFLEIADLCDDLLAQDRPVKICILGSESGISGSYDMAYAGAKAAMHAYVETKKLTHPGHMLVAIAPHIVWDSNMTQDRDDLDAVKARGEATRMGRWISAREVAELAYFLLTEGSPSLSGQVIRMRP